MQFEWDSHNRDKNWKKHQVTDREAEEVFSKGLFLGPVKSAQEERFSVIGKTTQGRTLFVVYTLRGEKIRVISVRDASRKERASYEQKIQEITQV